jgi:prevent-host-death family protein
MDVSVKDFREQIGRYLDMARDGADIIVTSHGKRKARLIPYVEGQKNHYLSDGEYQPFSKETEGSQSEGFLFGIWNNRDDMEDVEGYVRALRKGRVF